MRTSFSDSEDKALVQIAFLFEREGLRITWEYVARQMRTNRPVRQLKCRLASLKRTYGKSLKDFPRCFFGRRLFREDTVVYGPGLLPVRGRQALRTATQDHQGSAEAATTVHTTAHPAPIEAAAAPTVTAVALPARVAVAAAGGAAVAPRSSVDASAAAARPARVAVVAAAPAAAVEARQDESPVGLLTQTEASRALDLIFGDISAVDVRQPAGRTQDNAGEVLPPGISVLIGALGRIDASDVFLDVGAGIGNVLVQIALTTDVRAYVGVEMRADLCALAEARIQQHVRELPLLRKVFVKATDVRDADIASQSPTRDATIVFANIFLFEEDAKLVVTPAKLTSKAKNHHMDVKIEQEGEGRRCSAMSWAAPRPWPAAEPRAATPASPRPRCWSAPSSATSTAPAACSATDYQNLEKIEAAEKRTNCMQCYFSSGILDPVTVPYHVHMHFLQDPDYVVPTASENETNNNTIADKVFLERGRPP
ncbi:hypothetical protein ON010_g5 [Phytophthora cinnamomi]|nr:hypothetical protein ON010_g5 [Phytophthora cinnamomi]